MIPARDLILAVDGGQTSTKAIVARRDGTILGHGTGAPCDHIRGPNGREKNRAAIHGAALAAIAAANVGTASIVGVGLGLTSAPREQHAATIFREIVEEICTPAAFWVDSDFVSNLSGAAAGGEGIVVIAGGGSIGYGIDKTGREAISGGLGYLLGDDGSAWYLGIHAIQAATKAHDRRGPQTALLPLVMNAYGFRTIRDIVRVIYDASFTRDQVSVLAPDVVRLASEGDEVASTIVRTGAELLGDIALGVARQLHAVGDAIPVYPTGGVFAAGDAVMIPFAQRVRSEWPDARILPPRFPPVVGALIQVWKELGDDVTDDRLAAVERSLQS